MDIQFIEPCCASKQLPILLREQKMALFQTNGDVTFDHIIKAVSSLAGDELSIKMMIPTINVAMLRVLAWMGRRGWLKRLQILTHDNQKELIRKEVSSAVSSVSCYHNERVVESLLVIDGESNTVAVSGQFLTEVVPGHRFYMAVLGKSDSDHVRMLTATSNPLMKKGDVIGKDEPITDIQETETEIEPEADNNELSEPSEQVNISEETISEPVSTSEPITRKNKKK